MKKWMVLALASMTGAAQADLLPDFYIGGSAWQTSASGYVQADGDEVDLEDDLDIEDSTNFFVYAELEDVLSITPFVPDLRLSYTDVTMEGENQLDRSYVFGDTAFTVADTVMTDFEFSFMDATLYWELLDNVASLDLGATARAFDFSGSMMAQTGGQEEEVDLSGVIPMGFARVGVDLPLSGVYVRAQAQGISYDDKSFIDAEAKIGYESSLGLGLEAGYRMLSFDAEDFEGYNLDLQIDGVFAGLRFHL